MNDNNFEKATEDAAAFQKIWTESMSKMMQTAFAAGGNSPPPEMLRLVRSAIFESLAQSWEEFMRSPQFLDGMKQWMESAVTFRKMTNDFMSRVRNEMQAPSRDDTDSVMLAVRHLERRILDRLDGLSAEVGALRGQRANGAGKPTVGAKPKPKPRGTSNRAPSGSSRKEVT